MVIDLDESCDPIYGEQQLSLFHGYYGEYIYHPLFVFDGQDGFPLAAVLRPSNTHESHRAVAVLKRLLPPLQAAYPEALILVRADADFTLPAFYDFLEEREEVQYVIGFICNSGLLS